MRCRLPYGLKRVERVYYCEVIINGRRTYRTTKQTDLEAAMRYSEEHFYQWIDHTKIPVNPESHFRGKAKSYAKSPGKGACEVCGWLPPQAHPLLRHGKQTCHVHHVLPISLGGDNSDGNLLTLCPNHHFIAHRIIKMDVHPNKLDLVEMLTAIDRGEEFPNIKDFFFGREMAG